MGSKNSLSTWAMVRNGRRSLFVVGAFVGLAALMYVFLVAHSSSRSTSVDDPSPWGGGAILARSYPLAIPQGQPPNLPRVAARASSPDEAAADAQRDIYGGKGDGKHLGGFTDFDPDGVAPYLWSKMITELGVKSVMDVGCGRGISSRWFLEHKVKVLCVEGSHDAVSKSFLPPEAIVEHDYSRGPWWPRDTYDAVWSVEFLEHVSRQYMRNYIQTLRKAAVVFVTSGIWEGWHHVEIHEDEWWIRKFASHGFLYDEKLTAIVKEWAETNENTNYTLPTGEVPHPGHVIRSVKVFINPAVATLPEHAHLFAEQGCRGTKDDPSQPVKCGSGKNGAMETALPESFLPLSLDHSMHERWVKAIRAGINLSE